MWRRASLPWMFFITGLPYWAAAGLTYDANIRHGRNPYVQATAGVRALQITQEQRYGSSGKYCFSAGASLFNICL